MPPWLQWVIGVVFMPIGIVWGLVVMWRRGTFNFAVRLGLTLAAPVALFVLAAIGVGIVQGVAAIPATPPAAASAPETKKPSQATAPAPKPADEPTYEIVKIDDISVGATPRYEYRVVVSGTPREAQLKKMATAIFEKAKSDNKFSALKVGFFDYSEYSTSEYTLGSVEFAPNGDWASAISAEPGDYNSMKATAELTEKDWSKQLTASEVKVWAAWWTEYRKQAAAIGAGAATVDEDALTAEIAKGLSTTPEEVKAILLKKTMWTNQ